MTNQSLPRLRAWVDWDGDGWFNTGALTDPQNLCTNPLTLASAFRNQPFGAGGGPVGTIAWPATDIRAKRYVGASRGLYKWTQLITTTTGVIYVGWNRGTAGSYTQLFTPPSTGTYTIQGRINSNHGSSKTVQVQVRNVYPNPSNGTNITQTPITLTIPSGSQNTFFAYTFTVTNITNMQIGLEFFNPSTSFSMDIYGVSAYSGTQATEVPFNIGNTFGTTYDNIEGDIISAQWQLGYTSAFDAMPAEGTASLQLDNSLKKFSVEYSGSPFFKYDATNDPNFPNGRYPNTFPEPKFPDGVTMYIEVQDDTTLLWTEVWRGWVTGLDVGTGTSGPIATLSATQGFFKFDQVTISMTLLNALYPSPNYDFALTMPTLLPFLLSNYAIFPAAPNIAATNRTTANNAANYDIVSATDGYTLDTFLTAEPYNRAAWDSGTTLRQALEDLMVVSQGLFFIDRTGRGKFIQRDSIYTNSSAAPADLVWTDLITNNDDYQIVQPAVNSVQVNWYPASTVDGQLWKSRSPIYMKAKETKTFTVKLEYTEGSKLNAKSFLPFGSGSTATATDSAGVALGSTNFTIKGVLKGSSIDVTITNLRAMPIYVTFTINGTYYSDNGPTVVDKQSPYSFGNLGTRLKSVSNKLIRTQNQADALASHLLSLLGHRYNTFTSVTVSSRDATWLTRILTATVGTRVKYHENTYTGAIDHRFMVVGENASWTPGILTMHYTTRPADQYPFNNLGTTFYKQGGVVL